MLVIESGSEIHGSDYELRNSLHLHGGNILSYSFLYIQSYQFHSVRQILFGFAAQYTIMPALGTIISKLLGLPPSLSVGLILLSCCPGGTASNVVR